MTDKHSVRLADARELEALRDRVRNFSVTTPNWVTDGEWKESVLRSLLKGHLPAHVEPLRGFVVSPHQGSGQIDILLYDTRKPVLFRNGDLAFVTPDAVAGIVEVKSRIRNRGELREALQSLSDDAEVIRSGSDQQEIVFVGLFSYTTEITDWAVALDELAEAAQGRRERIVTHVCLGCSHFIRFWRRQPDGVPGGEYNQWHAYGLPDQAAGYFINNLVESVAKESVAKNEDVWFPEIGKEVQLVGTKGFAA